MERQKVTLSLTCILYINYKHTLKYLYNLIKVLMKKESKEEFYQIIYGIIISKKIIQ